MNIFFDVDQTLLALDGSLRPRAEEVFQALLDDGHTIYIWSGIGIRTMDMRRVGLLDYVSGVFRKPLSEFDQGLIRNKVPVVPDFIIDDYPEIVDHFGGYYIRPYHESTEPDDELINVLGLVAARAAEMEAASEA